MQGILPTLQSLYANVLTLDYPTTLKLLNPLTLPPPAEASTEISGGLPADDTPNFEEPADTNSDAISTFDSSMPPILNLQTTGLRRSPRIASQGTFFPALESGQPDF